MVHGWCTKCRRFRRVRIHYILPNRMAMGICQDCEDKK